MEHQRMIIAKTQQVTIKESFHLSVSPSLAFSLSLKSLRSFITPLDKEEKIFITSTALPEEEKKDSSYSPSDLSDSCYVEIRHNNTGFVHDALAFLGKGSLNGHMIILNSDQFGILSALNKINGFFSVTVKNDIASGRPVYLTFYNISKNSTSIVELDMKISEVREIEEPVHKIKSEEHLPEQLLEEQEINPCDFANNLSNNFE
jgi:hypothetical protein